MTSNHRILFVDNYAVVQALEREFGAEADYAVGDIRPFVSPASTLIAPGNSFGIMDGGIDLAIRDRWPGVERRVQSGIQDLWPAGLPVGAAIVVPLDEARFGLNTHLVYAPTMPVPCDISETPNVYMALSAALRMAPTNLRLLCPGLGTNTGGMSPDQAAHQMRQAWLKIPAPSNWDSVHRLI